MVFQFYNITGCPTQKNSTYIESYLCLHAQINIELTNEIHFYKYRFE
jgi:hypothetical protein